MHFVTCVPSGRILVCVFCCSGCWRLPAAAFQCGKGSSWLSGRRTCPRQVTAGIGNESLECNVKVLMGNHDRLNRSLTPLAVAACV